MITRDIDQSRPLARLAQQFLDDVVVRLRPMPAGGELPAIDDVAHQIDGFRIVMAKEIKELLGLAGARAEMHIGDEQRANSSRCFSSVHGANAPLPKLVIFRRTPLASEAKGRWPPAVSSTSPVSKTKRIALGIQGHSP